MLKKRVKALTGRMFSASRVFQYLTAPMLPVVAFHRVNDRLPGNGLTCDVKMFEEFCRFFSQEFQVVSLQTLVERLEQRKAVDRMLTITFDDGYIDNYEEAAPILKQFSLPATFFLTTGYIGTDVVAWWDRAAGVKEPWMNWRQVQELHRAGFEIGAHTRTHVDLGQVSGEDAWSEINGSRQDLKEKLSASISSFAYPYGRATQITEQNRDLIRKAGFSCCCSSFGGVNRKGDDLFSLRRIPIGSWHRSVYEFGFELALGKTECIY